MKKLATALIAAFAFSTFAFAQDTTTTESYNKQTTEQSAGKSGEKKSKKGKKSESTTKKESGSHEGHDHAEGEQHHESESTH